MRRLLIPLVLLVTLSTGCSLSSGGDERADDEATVRVYKGMNLEAFRGYEASYEIQFEGSYNWTYSLLTRSDGELVEHNLHIEGVEAARNPGDVRMVTNGKINWMIGPGTDNECIQYGVETFDLQTSFLTPDDLLPARSVDAALEPVDTQVITGLQANHYTAERGQLGDFQDVKVDIWLALTNLGTVRYDLEANGADPLFDAGRGHLTAHFLVNEVGAQEIEPVPGCDTDLPIPRNATDIVRLPGLISYNSEWSAQRVVTFYQNNLKQLNWEEESPPESSQRAVVMSYVRGNETLEISIEFQQEGVKVELFIE